MKADTEQLASAASPAAQAIMEALERARFKSDVRSCIDTYGQSAFREAWALLDPVVRGSLLLTRAFDGEVIQEADIDDIF